VYVKKSLDEWTAREDELNDLGADNCALRKEIGKQRATIERLQKKNEGYDGIVADLEHVNKDRARLAADNLALKEEIRKLKEINQESGVIFVQEDKFAWTSTNARERTDFFQNELASWRNLCDEKQAEIERLRKEHEGYPGIVADLEHARKERARLTVDNLALKEEVRKSKEACLECAKESGFESSPLAARIHALEDTVEKLVKATHGDGSVDGAIIDGMVDFYKPAPKGEKP
jgi:chromosome segregation ATPase